MLTIKDKHYTITFMENATKALNKNKNGIAGHSCDEQVVPAISVMQATVKYGRTFRKTRKDAGPNRILPFFIFFLLLFTVVLFQTQSAQAAGLADSP